MTPTNETDDILNQHRTAKLDPRTEITSLSYDTAVADVAQQEDYSTEFLHSLISSGLPPHKLRLRSGSLVMLLRNYASRTGLCNGTRVVVHTMHRHLRIARIVSPEKEVRREGGSP